jgi:hypothetical protein
MDGSLPTLNNSQCDGLSWSTSYLGYIPSNQTYAVATYEVNYSPPDNTTVLKEPRYRALQSCCLPNDVHKVEDDCIVWCELPGEYLNDIEEFSDCFNDAEWMMPTTNESTIGVFAIYGDNEGANENGEAEEEEDDDEDIASMHRPSSAALFTIATVFGYLAFIT